MQMFISSTLSVIWITTLIFASIMKITKKLVSPPTKQDKKDYKSIERTRAVMWELEFEDGTLYDYI